MSTIFAFVVLVGEQGEKVIHSPSTEFLHPVYDASLLKGKKVREGVLEGNVR